MKKIVLTSKFIQSNLSPQIKWLIVVICEQSKEGRINKKFYNDFNPQVPDLVLPDNDPTYLKINPQALLRLGLSILEPTKSLVPVEAEKIAKLFKACNDCRDLWYKKHHAAIVDPLVPQPNLYKRYNTSIDFLERHEVEDWFLYFYTLYHQCNWAFVWNAQSISAPKMLDWYHRNKDRCTGEIAELKNTKQAEVLLGPPPRQSKWISLYDHVEAMKASLLRDHKEMVCMNRIEDTLGYHPLSELCKHCPVAGLCQVKIYNKFKEATGTNMDIMKLRTREIDPDLAVAEIKKTKPDFELF